MHYARTFFLMIRRPPRGMLANLFRRCSCRYDHRARRQSARHRSVGMELRLLSGSEPGEISSDTAATFEEARADFEREWQVLFFETNRGRFSVVSQFEFPLPTQTILQPHGRSILAVQGQVGARDAQ